MFYQLHPMASADSIIKEYNENFNYPLHMHQCFELVVTLSGEMNIEINGTTYTLKEKEAVLIFPNRLHSFSSTESKHMLFIFSPKIVQAFSKKYADKEPESCKIILDEFVFEELKSLTPSSSIAQAKGTLYSVCARLERQTKFGEAYSDTGNLLMKIFNFVESNYLAECSLYEASRSIGYDHSYVSRYFKKMTGISYNSYVNICRLNHASYLLSNTDLSILECSIESGFKSLRSFNRNFKEYFGKTPVEYKK